MADETRIVGLKVGIDTGTSATEVKRLDDASGSLLSGLNGLSDGTGIATKAIGALAAGLAALELGRYIQDATMLAARVETLGVVMHTVGVNAGYGSREMDGFAKSIAAQGITTEASRQAAIRLAQAHVDLTKSSDLARIAQDAAVIANTNSSDAFDRMTTGISTGQAIILHHMGLMVNFEHGYKELATTLGKSTEDLTENEKTQARVNEVMKAGAGIAGSYESAMTTAGKQVTSLTRYFEEIKLAVGEPFTETFSLVLQDVNHSLKDLLSTMKDNKGAMVDFGHDVAASYRFLKNEANQLASALDMLGGEATRVAAIGMKSAELLTRFVTIGQFGDGLNERYEGLRQINKIYEERFKLHQNEINAYNAATGVSGPTLDPKEAMMLRMAREREEQRKIANRKSENTPKPGKETDTTDQLWNAYLSGLYHFNDQVDKFNPNLTELQKRLAGVDDELAKQLEKFKGYENNPGIQNYVESLKRAAGYAKDAIKAADDKKIADETFKSDVIGGDAFLNATFRMSDQQQYQFDQSAMQQNWATKYADNLRQEEKEQFDHNNIMAGLFNDITVKKLQVEERKTGDFQRSLLEQYDFQQAQDMLNLQWTLDHTALTEEQAERVRAQYRAKRKAADQQLTRDLTNNEQNLQQSRLTFASQATNGLLDLSNSLVTLTGKKNREMFILQKAMASANAVVNTAMGVTRALADLPYPYDFVVAGIISAAGAAQIGTIAATDIDSTPSTATTSLSGAGGGTFSSPVVTQPAGSSQQGSISITVKVEGNVIGEDRWVEERLAPAIRDLAKNRNVDFGLAVAA